MKNINRKLNTTLTIAALATVGSLAQVQPASAQLLELATGALSILGLTGQQSTPQFLQPQPVYPQNRSLTFGAENFNGNTLNLCITGCLPRTASLPTTPPVFTPPSGSTVIPQPSGVISQQSSFSGSSMGTPSGIVSGSSMGTPSGIVSGSSMGTSSGIVSGSSMGTSSGVVPPGVLVRPGVPVVPPTVSPTTIPVLPQPEPRRPILSIPPISLPFNL
jgi:hypothetical protein